MSAMPDFAKREVLSCLRTLSNVEAQRRAWIDGQAGGPASPDELVSQLFDDTALEDYLEDEEAPVFSEEIDDLLRRIGQALERIDLDKPAAALLEDPRWRSVRELADRAATLVAESLGEG